MVVSDKRVTKDPTFAGISVTADQWLPLIEVAEADLVQWMLQKRAQGYTLVGVEQTAESVLLPKFAFHKILCCCLGESGRVFQCRCCSSWTTLWRFPSWD